jgi:DNA-binding MarR family transcriptional regulator
MAFAVNMAVHPASPLFLTEPELRRGVELLHFGHSHLNRALDAVLAPQGLGRAHQRALYFIARQPDVSVTELLRLLAITKQSLGRVVTELTERGLVETRAGAEDRRQRLLRLTDAGRALEGELFQRLAAAMGQAYAAAGQDAVGGFWAVLEGLVPAADRARIPALRR